MKRELAGILAGLMLLGGCATVSGPAADTDNVAAVTEPAPETSAPEVTEPVSDSGYIPRAELLKCIYFNERDYNYYDSISAAYETDSELLCGVAPHHLTAGNFIASLYKTAAASRENIDTVVLAAPMHYESRNRLCTSAKGWSTAYGVLEADTELTALFCERLGAVPDDAMTEYDHSASSHIPFIKRYLPDAKVAVLLVSPNASRDFPRQLSELMYEMSQKKNCLFAFSIDFSHYLTPDKAEKYDEETLRAVTEGDTQAIERFTNNNVDTPYCLSAFVRLSALLGSEITSAAHANTFSIGSVPYSSTQFSEGVTSYFVFLSL